MRMGEIQRIQYDCQDTQELMVLMLVCPERLSIDERIETSEHLAQCPSCRQEYTQMKFAGDMLIHNRGYLRKNGEFGHPEPDFQAVEISHNEFMDELFQERLERAYIRRKRRERRERIAKIKHWTKPVATIAACMVLGIGLFFGVQSVNKPQDGPSPVAANLQQNPVQIELITGSTTEIIPPGQSIIATDALKVLRINGNRQMVLNVGTALKIEPCNVGCMVKLNHGEIYTEVEHDGKPFIVETIHGRAVITGTTFNIKVDNERMALGVVEGTVRLESDQGKVEVGGGNQSVIASGMMPTSPVTCDTGSIAGWARQEHLPELPGGASPRMDVTDLPGAVSLLSQSYNLEDIDFDVWIEQHREWFEREFPWTKRMQKLLAEKGIQVDTIQLLIESGDLWRFAWPEYCPTQMLGQTSGIDQAFAEKYQVDGSELTLGRQHRLEQLYGSEALGQWLNGVEEVSNNSIMDSIHATIFLMNTRSLAWCAVKTSHVQESELGQILELLSEQVRIASHSNDILNRLLLADKAESACSKSQFEEYTNDLKGNISSLLEIERDLEGMLE